MKVVDLSKPIRRRRSDPWFLRTTVRPKPRWLSRWLVRAAGLPFRLFPEDFEGWADDTITRMGVHATTHVDAPWHYGATSAGKPAATIDRMPLDRCIEEPDYWKRGTGMSAEATEWLIDRGIVVMGIDQWGWDLPLPWQIRRARADNDREAFWAAHRVGRRRPFWHMEQLVN